MLLKKKKKINPRVSYYEETLTALSRLWHLYLFVLFRFGITIWEIRLVNESETTKSFFFKMSGTCKLQPTNHQSRTVFNLNRRKKDLKFANFAPLLVWNHTNCRPALPVWDTLYHGEHLMKHDQVSRQHREKKNKLWKQKGGHYLWCFAQLQDIQ